MTQELYYFYVFPKGSKNICKEKDLDPNIHDSFIWQLYLFLPDLQKEQKTDTHKTMNRSQKYYAEWKKTDTKNTLYITPFTWNSRTGKIKL